MSSTAKPKGDLVFVQVVYTDSGVELFRNELRARHPGCSVRFYRRTVSADGLPLCVLVVVVRRKVSP